MTQDGYFRRGAWTLTILALGPTCAGAANMIKDETSHGLPDGAIMGGLTILTTVGVFGAALLLAWIALWQSTFARTLLVGIGIPVVLEVLFWFSHRSAGDIGITLAVLGLALPIMLGSAQFHGLDGRRWLRWGVGLLVAGVLALLLWFPYWMPGRELRESGYVWVPFLMVGVLTAVLHGSLKGGLGRGAAYHP